MARNYIYTEDEVSLSLGRN